MAPRVTAAVPRGKSSGAKILLHRSSRFEYDRSVRDLLDDPTDFFPPDAVEHGLDNLGAALKTSEFLLNGYPSTAETFVDGAVVAPARPEVKRYSSKAPFHPIRNRHDGQDLPGHYQSTRKNTSHRGGFLWLDDLLSGVPHSGRCKLRLEAARHSQRICPYDERFVGARNDEPLRGAAIAGSSRYREPEFRTSSDRLVAKFYLAEAPDWYEAISRLDDGYQTRLTFPNGPNRVKPLRRTLVKDHPDTFLEFIRGYAVPEGPINDETIDESSSHKVSKVGASTTALTRAGTSRPCNRRDGCSTFFSAYSCLRVRAYETEVEGPYFDTWPRASDVALVGAFEPKLERARSIL